MSVDSTLQGATCCLTLLAEHSDYIAWICNGAQFDTPQILRKKGESLFIASGASQTLLG